MSELSRTLDIEIYENHNDESWAQGKYLVHGYSDVMWTDSIDNALEFLRQELIELEQG